MVSSSTDDAIVAGVRAGDEAVFALLLSDWSRSMLMVARTFVSTEASAEEVVQDTWLAVIRGIDGFEGRSSLRTWVYRILVHTAKRRGTRESRIVPWGNLTAEDRGSTVDPALFRADDDQYPGGWLSFPQEWHSAEGSVLAGEVRAHLRAAIDALPDRKRVVITLRDVMGHSSDEVCDMLEISAANQRVLLHRARAAVRAQLADFLVGDDGPRDGGGELG
ncbi:RNA polymerase sigma factor [Aeromicrobium sp. 9AM]|uniref:RNA polymerase sigma factor n=1 Tax=Aeromicrobium sp. 9AM TaxID=2653126 RepID=UPI0012F199A2|nr:sigma-70 family RNA polymerase sigma factor [Aeromicrobium sp. 9AM]VXC24084.1 RNA polymerase subunit sigma-24 [Aeromicrobium sp. 9AM]